MTCSEIRDYLFAFLDNELDAPLSIEFQRHIGRCPECAREVEMECAIGKSLETVLIDPIPQTDIDEAVFRRAEASVCEGIRANTPFRLRKWAIAITSTAALLLIAALTWLRPWAGGAGPIADHFAELVVTDFEHAREDGLRVQFASSDVARVSDWLRDNTGLVVRLPEVDRPACRLIGARRCTIAGETAAFAMYQLNGVPASLVVTRGADQHLDRMARVEQDGQTHWLDRCKGLTVVACRRGELVIAAVSTLPEKELLCLMTDGAHEGD
ncbi:MAG: anti-sigma factor family protein [Phycisphaerae bacterium]